jgi:hypothetical protein
MATATMQRRTPVGVRAEHEVSLAPKPSAAPDPLATTRANLTSMRSVLQGLEARKHGRGFTDNDRIRLLRTRAVDGLLSDTVNLVKTDGEAVSYLRWRAVTAEAEANTMQERRPSMWFPGRRRAVDEQIREKRSMAQEAASFATSIEVDAKGRQGTPSGLAEAAPSFQRQAPAQAGARYAQGRVQKGLRGAGQFTGVAHGESDLVLSAPAPTLAAPAAAVQEPAGPSQSNRTTSDRQLQTLNDFLAPLETAAAASRCSPEQETHLLRGRRVRRILETAIQGTTSDAQVAENLQAIRSQADGQLRAATASAAPDQDRGALRARVQELTEVIKDCGTYRGYLGATA